MSGALVGGWAYCWELAIGRAAHYARYYGVRYRVYRSGTGWAFTANEAAR